MEERRRVKVWVSATRYEWWEPDAAEVSSVWDVLRRFDAADERWALEQHYRALVDDIDFRPYDFAPMISTPERARFFKDVLETALDL